MSRPPLPIGTYGKIRCTKRGNSWTARAAFRDYDGVTRDVERNGPTKTAAENKLKEALRDRARVAGSDDLSPDSKVSAMVDLWWGKWTKDPDHSPGTEYEYRRMIDRFVLPRLGELRLRELTVGRADRFLSGVADSAGPSTAKMVRSVLSNMCGLGARLGALPTNPVRDVERISVKTKPAVALSLSEVMQLLAYMTYDPQAIARDLLDFVSFLAATGVRHSEALGLRWNDIDFAAGTVSIRYQVIRISKAGRPRHRMPGDGGGLVLKAPKSAAGVRVMVLPKWALRMLELRRMTVVMPKTFPTIRILQADGTFVEETLTADTAMVFPSTRTGTFGLRDPHNVHRQVRQAYAFAGLGGGNHKFRKSVATAMDKAGLTARSVADQLGQSRVSITQDHYIGRGKVAADAAEVLEPIGDLWA